MESVKKSVKNFGKGFGIWLILLLLNSRAGESSVNGIKIIMDTLLSIILIGNNKKAREAALGISELVHMRQMMNYHGKHEMYSGHSKNIPFRLIREFVFKKG